MIIHQNQSLKPYNSFGIDIKCEYLYHIYSTTDIFEFLLLEEKNFIVLGGGSNLLFTKDFDGSVLKNEIKGIEIIDEDEDQILVRVGAGENWHQFVQWCVSHHLWGLENLSLIPGNVGAAPIQNIGAYGVEQNTCFHSLQAINADQGISEVIYNSDCKFGYRDSIFKSSAKGKYIITHVRYMLSKKPKPNLSYKEVAKYFEDRNMEPSIKNISNAIIEIRNSKLPDPCVTGNAGSFFKNPVIEVDQFNALIEKHPEVVHYPTDHKIKLAAAWLIDQCGFKGKIKGNTGSYKNQALIIINNGQATGAEIFNYSKEIQTAVFDKFGIELEAEVNII